MITRYSRHHLLAEVGPEGQAKLQHAKILCIGAGGLGAPLLFYLAAAGVGTIGIVDDDRVDLSNLQRQIIYKEDDIGELKTDCAKKNLLALNSELTIHTHNTRVTHDNALELIRNYDLIADGCDNFATRYIVNDACHILKKPLIAASIFQFEGQCSVFMPEGPCYRCLYPAPPPPTLMPNCAEAGVLGVLPGVLGSIQATEVLKVILNKGQSLAGRLLSYDALAMNFKEHAIEKNPSCLTCQQKITYDQLPHHGELSCMNTHTISIDEFDALRAEQKEFFLLDVREPHEYQEFNLQGYLIPLSELPKRFHELDKNKKIIVHCALGGRSAKAAEYLREQGVKTVLNLAGGTEGWKKKHKK
jgi:molybdopterin/thiamine biosynthesis adenylyltransferase/rhodanese-related sulfurtransferase